jgi:hypothetical protein
VIVSENEASEATSSNHMDQQTPGGSSQANGAVEFGADGEGAVEIEVEEIAPPPPAGFQAFLQHANLHNLLQIENLSRTTGVFLVVSQGRTGYLHLSNGELVHAETGGLTGEAAAASILSWDDGEFKSCSRALSSVITIHSSLQSLLLRLAKASDEAAHWGRMRRAGTPAPRPLEEDKPTEPHLPAPQAAALAESAKRPSGPPRSSRVPPPLPPRIERESTSIAEVAISATGEIVQSRGPGAEEFSARVAYAARLADLIGRAIRSGTPRALELRGKSTQTQIKWQPDGALSASLELVQSTKR